MKTAHDLFGGHFLLRRKDELRIMKTDEFHLFLIPNSYFRIPPFTLRE
jgi:hypothetical protein